MDEQLRLLEQERRELENAWLNSAVDQREYNLMRREYGSIVYAPGLATGPDDCG